MLSRLATSALDPRIHIFRRSLTNSGVGELEVDAYVLATERFLIFCDTLLCPEDAAFMAAPFLQSGLDSTDTANSQPDRRQWLVINSHSDWDHVWGNAYFLSPTLNRPTPPIIGHRINAARQRSPEAQTTLQNYQQQEPLFAHVRSVAPTITFEQDMTIDGGDLTLELFYAPGHCLDHIAGWLPQIQTLLAFDALEWPFPSIESAATVPLQIATLRRFLALQPRVVLYQHSAQNGVDDARIIQHCLDYLLTIERRCRELVAGQHISEEEISQNTWAQHIGYPAEAVTADYKPIASFYRDVHEENVRNVLRYILKP